MRPQGAHAVNVVVSHAALESLSAAGWRIGLGLTAAITGIYVDFILVERESLANPGVKVR